MEGKGKPTLEMAEERVGLGVVFFAPNSRFMVAAILCWSYRELASKDKISFS